MAYVYFSDDIEVEVDDFMDACSDREIRNVIEYLIRNQKITRKDFNFLDDDASGVLESEFREALIKLNDCRLQLSNEDTQTILNISKKY